MDGRYGGSKIKHPPLSATIAWVSAKSPRASMMFWHMSKYVFTTAKSSIWPVLICKTSYISFCDISKLIRFWLVLIFQKNDIFCPLSSVVLVLLEQELYEKIGFIKTIVLISTTTFYMLYFVPWKFKRDEIFICLNMAKMTCFPFYFQFCLLYWNSTGTNLS